LGGNAEALQTESFSLVKMIRYIKL